MPTEPHGVTRRELPQGCWLRVGSRMVRVVENTIGGHVIEIKLANRRERKRDDGHEFDKNAREAL